MGRPSSYPGAEVKPTTVRLRAETWTAAKDYGAGHGQPLARVLADALELYLADRVDDFTPWLILDQQDRQPALEDVA